MFDVGRNYLCCMKDGYVGIHVVKGEYKIQL